MELQAWQIVLIVLGSIVAAYLLIVIIDISFLLSFRTMLSKHITAFEIVLRTKYDNLKKLLRIMVQYDAKAVEKYIVEIDKIDMDHLAKPHTAEGEKVRNALSYIKEEAMSLLNNNEVFAKHEEIILSKQHILELDKSYYFQIMNYNADIIGYNYWLNFLPTRYIYKILKIKPKDIIA